jgi:hypothetical protein
VTVATAPVLEQPPAPRPTPPAPHRHLPRALSLPTAAALVGLVVLALALRLEAIKTWYWIDEALSVGLARHDLVDIPRLLLRDGSPPLWYLLLHLWMRVFGTSVVATHSLSLVFAVAIVPVSWVLARRTFGERTAWMVGALAALSPFVTYFARETRMYSLVVLLAVVVAASFVSAFVDGSRRATWVFGASLTALLYTHNWALYTAFACVVALVPIAIASPERRALVRRAVVTFAVVGVLYLPWAPALLSQIHNTGAPWSFTPSLRDVAREIAALFRDERILLVLVIAGGLGLSPVVRRPRSRDALAAIALAILVVVPVGIGWAFAHVEPSWATRYLAVVVAPLLLLLGLGLARAGGAGVAAVIAAGILVLQPFTRLNGLPLPRDAKSNAHAVAAAVAPRLEDGDLVVVAQPEAVPLLRLELGPKLRYADPTGLVADPTTMDWRDAEDRLRAATFDDLAPVLDEVPVGGRVAVFSPGNPPRSTDTTWVRLFRASAREVARRLRVDPRFAVIDRVRGHDGSYVGFDAIVFERVAKRPT